MKKQLTLLFLFASLSCPAQISFTGAGILFKQDKTGSGYPEVMQVMKFSPAEDAGIAAGDVIWSVDGKEVNGLTAADVSALIKGEAGKVRTLVVGSNKREIALTLRFVKGKCTEGDCQNGEGRVEEPNGNVYKGGFTSGKFDGYGAYWFKTGEEVDAYYEGFMVNGKREGEGKLVNWKKNYRYKGEFKADKFNGKAEITFEKSKAVYEGSFVNDAPVGSGTMTLPSGEIKNFTPKSWDDLYAAAGQVVQTHRETIAQQAPKRDWGIDKEESSSSSSASSVDWEDMKSRMQKTEVALSNTVSAYNSFRQTYYEAKQKYSSSETSESYSASSFNNYLQHLNKASTLFTEYKNNLPDAEINERQVKAIQGWTEEIITLLRTFKEVERGGAITQSAAYWQNLNSDKLNEAVSRAGAQRRAF